MNLVIVNKCRYHPYFLMLMICCLVLFNLNLLAQNNIRTNISLNNNWKTIAIDSLTNKLDGFENPLYNDKKWKQVNVPHTWDEYEGYRRMRHGNRHGYAFYRNSFSVNSKQTNKHFFLFFEGVGSYVTVWLNNKKVGYHAGGRTTFTLDVTNAIFKDGRKNTLVVRADHPAFIQDLPWVCGGCSDERGFSEGSQAMGIFRPVQLIITNEVRIEPFGIHIWNDSTATSKSASLNIETEIKNYGNNAKNISVVNKIINKNGVIISTIKNDKTIASEKNLIISQQTEIDNPVLWDLQNPYLYTLVSEIYENGKLIDQVKTNYGIRTISWPLDKQKQKQFLLNGKPIFINGIAEYEHQLGASGAFTDEEIHTRAMMVKAGGFNAFRDAHQPHNLRYQNYWDSLGILWWPQLSAHIWYDTPTFKDNFKSALKEWVKERRNSPSIILWGLQNESKLPKEFAQECSQIIRELDPTASSQRKITTCNGGEGTDWDVPQNWTGTYGGNPATYSEDIKKQVLIGEYGAWRTLDLHSEGGFQQNGILSEDRMTQLMETKVKLAEYVKDSTAGQFFWLLTSHDNPGRVQGGEGLRELDKIGPVNYKGLFTPWEEPLDVFYMFRSNYAPKSTEPMVYIVSHTWPDRWLKPGKKDSIIVYSNCDEVELFNDVNNISLGRKKRGELISHFQWDKVDINYNVLYAVGYVNGKAVAKDIIVLNHLPPSPEAEKSGLLDSKNLGTPLGSRVITAPQKGYNYLYRVNCGGPDYKDVNGNIWLADGSLTDEKAWGSISWTNDFPGIPSFFASQRRTFSPITGTQDQPLFQDFRYGRDKLKYQFPVPDGNYLIELYFTEPWLGIGGGMDCTGWRKFDIAVNEKTVIKDLDIWKECQLESPRREQGQIAVGANQALKKTIIAHVSGGQLIISFPQIKSGQAIISAIAIASLNKTIKPAPASKSLIENLSINNQISNNFIKDWMDNGNRQFVDSDILFSALPSQMFGAQWLQLPLNFFTKFNNNKTIQFTVTAPINVFVALDQSFTQIPSWLKDFVDTKSVLETGENGGTKYFVYRKSFAKAASIVLGNTSSQSGKFIVAAMPTSAIEPAFDLKPAITYKAPQAKLLGSGLIKTVINEKESVLFNRDSGDTIDWKISIGAADVYSLTIKYANNAEKKLTGKLEILAADGTIMKTSATTFLTTKAGKWNYIDSTTGTMINAGNYTIRLTTISANGLGISGLDVQ